MSQTITITLTVEYSGQEDIDRVATELARFLKDNCTDEYWFPSLTNAAVESVAIN